MKYEGRLVAREWRARTTRIDTGYDVTVRCAAGAFAAQVINLSSTGFRIASDGPLEEGVEIALEARGADPIKAVIRWVAGLEAGGVFLEPPAL
jgi:PilZ domain-containing protein